MIIDSIPRRQSFDLVVGDNNESGDGFLYSTAIFTDGFESGDTSSWSSASPLP